MWMDMAYFIAAPVMNQNLHHSLSFSDFLCRYGNNHLPGITRDYFLLVPWLSLANDDLQLILRSINVITIQSDALINGSGALRIICAGDG